MNIAYKRAKTSTLRIEKGASAVIAASRSSGTQSGFRSGYGYRPQGWIRNLLPRFASFASMRGSHGQFLRTIVLVCLTASSAVTQTTPYPKPQVPSAVAQLAPDFRLKNQDGKVFHLAALRGHGVLLFFYRGYW